MDKVLIFTDIHFVEEGRLIGHLDPGARFAAGLAHALAHHPDAARIVIAGDLTHDGEIAQYRRLRQALRDCPVPVDLMLGNHDRRAQFCAVFEDAPLCEAGFVQGVADVGAHRLIMLDTLDEAPRIPHGGILCGARLAWLDAALRDAGARPVVLFTHHPPMDVGFPAMDRIGLRDRGALLDLLARHGNVRQIVSGHIHRTISTSAGGIPAAVLKGTCHQAPMMLGGADSHASVDEPGAYGILLLHKGGVIVHSEDFGLPDRRILHYA